MQSAAAGVCSVPLYVMEQRVKNSIEQSLNNNQPLSSQILASVRSLIVNPSTSDSTLTSLLDALTRALQLTRDSVVLHHILKLLTDLSIRRPQLSSIALDLLRSDSFYSSDKPRLVGESLSALVSLTSPKIEIDGARFALLCFGPSVSVRLWLLKNAEKFAVRESVLFAVFLGFTKDPYPYVRKAALDGLVKLCRYSNFDDRDVIEGCYFRAVELLRDAEDYVRSYAVRAVLEWGKLLVISSEENNKQELADLVFIQLCSMVRDMTMEVRFEAFDALGEMGLVSEDILLQTLFKKVLAANKDKIYNSMEGLEALASVAAGAFVHGLEDEFSEVRLSACKSLCMFTVFSLRFAAEALNLLMDMLNDDTMVVRLQSLNTMHHMATIDHLIIEEIHMHRFLGTLSDSSFVIRSATRKILKLAKLPKLQLFKLCVDSLLENLETYPQDEVDAFSVLFHLGRNHGKFTVSVIEEVSPELEPAFGGISGFDSTRVAAFLVLAISAPLSIEKDDHGVPPRIFSYAVTWLGRISYALSDVMSQEKLLSYLSECSRSSTISPADFQIKEPLPAAKGDIPIHLCSEADSLVEIPSMQKGPEQEEHHELRKSVNLIFRNVKDLWPLVQLGRTNEALKAIRAYKQELASFTPEYPVSAGYVAFTLQYLQVTKLFAALWAHLMPTKRFDPYGVGKLELLLVKLDRRLREIRNRFIGLSKGEELQILELIALGHMLRLSKIELCCYETTLKKLSNTISDIESLYQEDSIEPSPFIAEVKKSLHEVGSSIGGDIGKPLLFTKLLSSFSLQQFVICESLKHINAGLEVPGNDSENPLPFISGIPTSIPLAITLCNVPSESRLWLRISTSGVSTQFVFIDLNLIGGGSDKIRDFTFTAPYYRTPNAVSFTLRISIGMECLQERNIHLIKFFGGPKCELIYLCPEREVFVCKSTKF